MEPSDLALYTSQELIDELMRRTTFLGDRIPFHRAPVVDTSAVLGLQTMMTRRSEEGDVIWEEDRVSLDDAVRAFGPREILLSSLYEARFGLLRRDLVEWAKDRFDVPVTHIPVRVDDDAVRWDVTHTLVVGTQTIASPDLIARLKARAAERPHRYTMICPRSGDLTREDVVERLARTLAEMYRSDIDATGQPMSPEPFAAIENAIEHYRIDDILISTLAGQQSRWLEQGLIERVEAITDKPVEHYEAGQSAVRSPQSAEIEVGA